MIEVIDNFLPEFEFDVIKQYMMGEHIGWTYGEGIDYPGDGNYQFVHFFFWDSFWKNNGPGPIAPLYTKLNPVALCKIKANMIMPTKEIVVNNFHVDQQPAENFTTAILYINSNDGYTEFEDGTIVESVANRLVKFPSNIKHRGTSATTERRIVININYVQQMQ